MPHVIRDKFNTPMAEFGLQISMGMWNGATKIHRFFGGTVSSNETTVGDVNSNTTFEWVEPSSYGAISIVSTSSHDAPGGDGVEQALIFGVTNSYDFRSEIVALDGLTPVTTSNADYIHSWRMFTRHTDTVNINSSSAIGDIAASIAGTETSKIFAGKGGTLQSAMIIPRGFTGYIFKGKAAAGAGKTISARFSVIETTISDSGTQIHQPKVAAHEFLALESAYEYKFSFPADVPALTRVEVIGNTATGTAVMTGAYDLLLMPDNFDVQA